MATSGALKPSEIVTGPEVTKVLEAHFGSNAKLGSYNLQFLKKGDHFCSSVLRLNVAYKMDGTDKTITYVVKLFAITSPLLLALFSQMFKMEIYVYTELLPSLNNQLERLNLPPLKTPRCHHSSIGDNYAIIYFEDMCADGFKTQETSIPYDEAHARLVMKEIARFHAASKLLFDTEEVTIESVAEKYPLVSTHMDTLMTTLSDNKIDMLQACFNTGKTICDGIPEYTFVSNYLKNMKDVGDKYDDMVKPTEKYFVIRHGDLKNNNVMFKYDKDGKPIETVFIDFQLTSIGSNVLDIIHFVFPSMESKKREKATPRLLDEYEKDYKAICARRNLITFSKEDFVKEYESKMLYALIMSLCLIPLTTLDEHIDIDFVKLFTAGPLRDAELAKFDRAVAASMKRHCMLRPRFLDLLDYFEDKNLFKID